MPMPLTIGTSRALLGQANADAAWLALLQANATYAWDSVQGLSLAAWVDVVQGVEATAAGTGTTLGTLNGRAAAVFNGSGRYATAAFPSALAGPLEIVSVVRRDTSVSQRRIVDGIVAGNGPRTAVEADGLDRIAIYASTFFTSTILLGSSAAIVRVRFDGASSQVRKNEGTPETGNAGALTGLTGLQIAQAATTFAFGFIGPIAHVSIYHGARLANAATVAAAAQQYYGIS
jgi:hypothetical protein